MKLLLLLMMPLALYAQNKGPFVNVVTSHDKPLVENTWTFTLYIDYPDPDGVSVIAPSFNGFLSLERIVKYPRVMGNNVQTAVEYRFVPVRSGSFTLEKFTVVCPDGVTQTNPYVLEITAQEGQKPVTLRLNWEIEPPQKNTAWQITAGERVGLTLRALEADSLLPQPEFFLQEVPPGVLLSLSQVSDKERKNGVAAKFTLIPLTAEDFRLDARTLQHENIRFYIPGLQINVNPQNTQNTPRINSQDVYVSANIPAPLNTVQTPSGQTSIKDFSDNANFLQGFLPVFSLFVFILVIITPFICLTLFERKK
jgi:hypothetical protein